MNVSTLTEDATNTEDSTHIEIPQPLLRSRPVATKMLGKIGLTTLDGLLNEGKLKKVKIGRRTFVTDESIRRLVAERSQ